ncbi:MAG: peptidoglycan DD-metalloendopeptidase family protein [Pseudomonadota bacterium]
MHYKKLSSVLLISVVCFSILFWVGSNPLVFASSLYLNDPDQTNLSETQTIKEVVKKGDTASSLLNPYLELKTIYEISKRNKNGFSLDFIKRGQPYKFVLKGKDLVRFEYEIDMTDRLVVQKENNRFSVRQEAIEYDIKLESISAVITSSLFEAVKKSGEKCELAMQLSDIFAWDIDFIRDIQSGDQFQVLVEKRYRNGKLCGYGEIQAAFFTNQQTFFKAFLYKDSNGRSGYYDENGNSLQKAFLKAPLSFSRISSMFTKKRMHPIFKEYRSHPGVDYAAAKGTPIKTVGDGIITRIGFNKGMGKYIQIRHYNGYITSYNHMSRFHKGMKNNKKLAQGDVIGYVGMTGYATGPHLDFRMKKNGRLIDPLKHHSPSATPVTSEDMELFLARSYELSARMLTAENKIKSDKKET